MKKAILAIAAAATLAAATMSAPTPADARCYGCGVGAGVAAGGLIAGAIIGGAIANSQPRYYAPAPGYVVYDGYGAPLSGRMPGRLLGPPPALRPLGQFRRLEQAALRLPLSFA